VSEAHPDERWRLFIALDLPDDARDLIAAWQGRNAAAAAAGEWRPVKPEQLHLTLAFLGAHPPARAAEVGAALQALSPRPVPATLLPDPVPLPRRQPRLMALDVACEAAATLQAPLAVHLRESGLLKPEERPFWPHITTYRRSVAAARKASRAARIAPLEVGGEGDGHAFGFVRVALYRSENRPEGSSYSRLAARDLPRPSGNPER
jgi:RNA 2',3'-cyclic 3'-phosphodiesterase